MGVVIKVGMADLKTGKAPDILTTLGLGSCIGIALWDPVTKIGGLAHVMLPDSTKIRNNSNIAKFADTGITELVRQMEEMGVLYNFLGLTTGCIIHGITPDQRRAAYACDITYGTNNDFTFFIKYCFHVYFSPYSS